MLCVRVSHDVCVVLGSSLIFLAFLLYDDGKEEFIMFILSQHYVRTGPGSDTFFQGEKTLVVLYYLHSVLNLQDYMKLGVQYDQG